MLVSRYDIYALVARSTSRAKICPLCVCTIQDDPRRWRHFIGVFVCRLNGAALCSLSSRSSSHLTSFYSQHAAAEGW